MPGLTVKVLLQDIKKINTEALIVGFYEDVRPLKGFAEKLDWLLCGSLSRLIIDNRLKGSVGDLALITSRGKVPAQKIFMIGLGRSETLSPSLLQNAARTAATTLVAAGVTNAALEYFPGEKIPYDTGVSALRKGLSEGAEGHAIDITLLAPDAAAYETMLKFSKG